MIHQSVITVTPPAAEPVSLEDAKLFMRVDGYEDDTLIKEMLEAAREAAEAYTGRAFITRTLKLTMDCPPCHHQGLSPWWDGVREGPISMLMSGYAPIQLPFPPLIAVTSVTAIDTASQPETLEVDAYQVDTAGARLILREGTVLPTLREQNGLEITYTAGYGASAANVPAKIRLAIKQACSAFYEVRDCGELPTAVMAMLDSYRVMSRL